MVFRPANETHNRYRDIHFQRISYYVPAAALSETYIIVIAKGLENPLEMFIQFNLYPMYCLQSISTHGICFHLSKESIASFAPL